MLPGPRGLDHDDPQKCQRADEQRNMGVSFDRAPEHRLFLDQQDVAWAKESRRCQQCVRQRWPHGAHDRSLHLRCEADDPAIVVLRQNDTEANSRVLFIARYAGVEFSSCCADQVFVLQLPAPFNGDEFDARAVGSGKAPGEKGIYAERGWQQIAL